MKRLHFCKKLYSRTALLKAAYHFTDRFYVYLDQDEKNFHVELTAKAGTDENLAENEFSNELLAQTTREEILRQTANIRELILGRAFGSTIIEDAPQEYGDTSTPEVSDGIFSDWYKK